jgi:hypothetical protein
MGQGRSWRCRPIWRRKTRPIAPPITRPHCEHASEVALQGSAGSAAIQRAQRLFRLGGLAGPDLRLGATPQQTRVRRTLRQGSFSVARGLVQPPGGAECFRCAPLEVRALRRQIGGTGKGLGSLQPPICKVRASPKRRGWHLADRVIKDETMPNFKFTQDYAAEATFGLLSDWMLKIRGTYTNHGSLGPIFPPRVSG